VDPSVRGDVARVVAERLADAAAVARSRTVPIAVSLAYLALATPGLDAATVALAGELISGRAVDRPGRLRRLWRWLTARP
jgi:hypothetical protein